MQFRKAEVPVNEELEPSGSLESVLRVTLTSTTMSTFLRHFVHRTFASYPRVLSARHLSSSTAKLKDPWPLPHTPEHIASTASPADLPPPKPLARPGEIAETKRARLVYQSRKRGTLESDLLLSTFAQEHLGAMDAEELSEFDKVRFKKIRWRTSSESVLRDLGVVVLYYSSLWTNRTGTFIIGLRENGRCLSGGRTRKFSRS